MILTPLDNELARLPLREQATRLRSEVARLHSQVERLDYRARRAEASEAAWHETAQKLAELGEHWRQDRTATDAGRTIARLERQLEAMHQELRRQARRAAARADNTDSMLSAYPGMTRAAIAAYERKYPRYRAGDDPGATWRVLQWRRWQSPDIAQEWESQV